MSQPVGNCPGCGAPVKFRFSAAVQTVCEFCHSILVRHDLDLTKVGEVADLPPEVSPIQIGTEGAYEGQAFTVAGRILYEWEQGGWNEWHIVFQDGKSAWLSDAQAEYAISRQYPAKELPRAEELFPGKVVAIGGATLTVSTVTLANYRGVEGELPFEYWDKAEVRYVDLRGDKGGFATIDYSESPPLLFGGRAVKLKTLQLKNLREFAAPELGRGAVKGMYCPNCGAAVTLRAEGQSLTAVCAQCLSILDATTPSLKVLQQYKVKERAVPSIPLGQRGTLAGVEWEAIGFQRRFITVDDSPYSWHEYVLFHREQGFRYLTEYEGHWNFVTPMEAVPEETVSGARRAMRYDGLTYRHFQGASAETDYVLGEFPWRVRVGERVFADDYVSPPKMLSSEKTEKEITWSVGEYTEGAEIWQAFQLPLPVPAATGVYANQPSPHSEKFRGAAKMFRWFALALILVLTAMGFLARSKTVFEDRFRFTAGQAGEKSFVTKTFELDGRTSNVEVEIRSDLSNAWTYFNLALINETTGQAWDWGRELSRYDGEGSRDDTSLLSDIPSGRYYLRVEPEWSPSAEERSPPQVEYTVQIRRDVMVWWPVILAFPLLVVPLVLRAIQYYSFESRRWQESSYASEASSGDDSSEDDE